MTYLDHLSDIAECDVAGLRRAQQSYGDSWKKRGGIGAFMMLARKWDRIEKRVSTREPLWDIFEHINNDKRSEGIIDDIRDLRRYLLLVEAEMTARKAESAQTVHRDNSLDLDQDES